MKHRTAFLTTLSISLLTLAILVASPNANAQENTTDELFSGVYIGFGIGSVASTATRTDIADEAAHQAIRDAEDAWVADGNNPSPNFSFRCDPGRTPAFGCFDSINGDEESFSSHDAEFRPFVGYRMTFWDKFVAGAEFHVSAGDSKSTTVSGVAGRYSGDRFDRQGVEFGVSFLAGYLLNPADLMFARVGYSRAKYDVNFSIQDQNNPEMQYYSTNIEKLNGLSLGIGEEVILSGRLSLRLDYTYNRYGSVKIDDFATNAERLCNTNPGIRRGFGGPACRLEVRVPGTGRVDNPNRVTVGVIDDDLELTHDQFMVSLAYTFRGGNESPESNNELNQGLFIGIGGGRGAGSYTYERPERGERESLEIEGWLGRGFVGFDWAIREKFVTGINTSYQFSNLAYKKTVGFNTNIEQTNEFTVTSILGYKLHKTSMLFFESGYARGSFDISRRTDAPSNEDVLESGKNSLNGYIVGLGLKTAVWDNVFLQFNYQFVDFTTNGNFYNPGNRTSRITNSRFNISFGYTLPVGSWL